MSVTIKNSSSRPGTSKTYYSQFPFLILFLLLFFFGQNTLLAGNNAVLSWTAPGDDNNQGKGNQYDIRYSSVPIGSDTLIWWNLAIRVDSVPEPSSSGHEDSCMIHNLSIDNSHYFALRTADEANNWSGISNIAIIPPLFCIDMSGDGLINILDILYLLNYLFLEGAQLPLETSGDVNHSGGINVLDAIYIINYCYKSGPPPDCEG